MRLLVVSVLLVFGFPVIMNEVEDSFYRCRQFFLNDFSPEIPGILRNSVSQNNNRYKLICQQFKNKYRFATLYDINKKIPVFSAYRYTGHHTENRPSTPWRTEEQLDTSKPLVNQAHNDDYKNNGKGLDRGHLLPSSYAEDIDTSKSTFTLTNAVPQHNSFNTGSWNRMEQRVRDDMDAHCRDQHNPYQTLAFGLTGAVASQANLMKHKVNIPTHMWTVFCCYNSTTNKWESQAHWAENKEETRNVNIPTITLERLEEFLQTMYGPGITLFTEPCGEILYDAKGETMHSEPEGKDKRTETNWWWDLFNSVPQRFHRFLMRLKNLYDFVRG